VVGKVTVKHVSVIAEGRRLSQSVFSSAIKVFRISFESSSPLLILTRMTKVEPLNVLLHLF
jgi:hypothetical protein